MVKTPRSQCRVPGVRSLVGELDPTCMPQLRSLPDATKTQHNQINKNILKEIISSRRTLNILLKLKGIIIILYQLSASCVPRAVPRLCYKSALL